MLLLNTFVLVIYYNVFRVKSSLVQRYLQIYRFLHKIFVIQLQQFALLGNLEDIRLKSLYFLDIEILLFLEYFCLVSQSRLEILLDSVDFFRTLLFRLHNFIVFDLQFVILGSQLIDFLFQKLNDLGLQVGKFRPLLQRMIRV